MNEFLNIDDLEIELIELEDLENLKRDIENRLNDIEIKFSQILNDELESKLVEIRNIESRIDEKLDKLEIVVNKLNSLEKKLDNKFEYLESLVNSDKSINGCEEVLRGFKEVVDRVLNSSKDKETFGVDIYYQGERIFSKDSVVGEKREVETNNGLFKLDIDGKDSWFRADSSKVLLKVGGYKKIYIGDKLKDLSKKRGGINGKKSEI